MITKIVIDTTCKIDLESFYYTFRKIVDEAYEFHVLHSYQKFFPSRLIKDLRSGNYYIYDDYEMEDLDALIDIIRRKEELKIELPEIKINPMNSLKKAALDTTMQSISDAIQMLEDLCKNTETVLTKVDESDEPLLDIYEAITWLKSSYNTIKKKNEEINKTSWNHDN